MRIVLDTNSLIRCIPRHSRHHAVWLSFVDGRNTLCITNEIIEEYTEILQRLTDIETAELVISTIINSKFTEFVTPYYHFELISADKDDNKFVDCAIIARAKFIVTDDRHFDVLKQNPYPKVDVISLDNFLKYISN